MFSITINKTKQERYEKLFLDLFMQSVLSAPFAVLFGFKFFFNFFLVFSRPIVDMLALFALEFY